jgi:hypothetical protein
VIESAVGVLPTEGAEVVAIQLPRLLLGIVNGGAYETIRDTEFRSQIEEYLRSLTGTRLPRTHADIIRLIERVPEGSPDGWFANPARLVPYRREADLSLTDQSYLNAVLE